MNTSSKSKKFILLGAIVIVVIVILVIRNNKPASNVSFVANQPTRSSESAFAVDLNTVNFNTPVNPTSSKDLRAADKKAIYESLLAGYKIMTSRDAKAIRGYMTKKASTSAEKNLVTKMTDADLVSLSTRLGQTMIMPTPDLFLTSSSIWTKNDNTVSIQYMDPSTGTTTKSVVNINGQWY